MGFDREVYVGPDFQHSEFPKIDITSRYHRLIQKPKSYIKHDGTVYLTCYNAENDKMLRYCKYAGVNVRMQCVNCIKTVKYQ